MLCPLLSPARVSHAHACTVFCHDCWGAWKLPICIPLILRLAFSNMFVFCAPNVAHLLSTSMPNIFDPPQLVTGTADFPSTGSQMSRLCRANGTSTSSSDHHGMPTTGRPHGRAWHGAVNGWPGKSVDRQSSPAGPSLLK